MKRIVVAMIAALLLAGSALAVAVVSSPSQARLAPAPAAPAGAASAAPWAEDCPYVGCWKTRTYLRSYGRIREGRKIVFTTRVRAAGSARYPRGSFVFTIRGPGTDIRRTEAVVGRARTTFTVRGLRAGRYEAAVAYRKQAGSPFYGSTSPRRILNVNKARRR